MQTYALVASDEPMRFRYIGRTGSGLWSRLCRHVYSARGGVRTWIDTTLASGLDIEIVWLASEDQEYQWALKCVASDLWNRKIDSRMGGYDRDLGWMDEPGARFRYPKDKGKGVRKMPVWENKTSKGAAACAAVPGVVSNNSEKGQA